LDNRPIPTIDATGLAPETSRLAPLVDLIVTGEYSDVTVQKRTFRHQRRNRLASALAVSFFVGCVGSTTGCSSGVGTKMASLNPFSKSQTNSGSSSGESSWLSGPKNVGSSIAGGAKDAATKSQQTVAGWFGGGDDSKKSIAKGDDTDPTSLAHKGEVNAEVFVANGRLWESTGNFEKAMQSYAKALEKEPSDPEALANIARLHFRQNNHEQAAKFFGLAIQENPEEAGLYNDLGLTLSKLGNHGAAASTIEQALRLSPGSSRYANNLASVQFEGGNPSDALEVLVKNNKPAVAHFNMAYLHYKHGQTAESTRHLNQALAYQPQAETDAATKRAVERSRELLAQIGNVPGAQNGTPIAGRPPSQNVATAAAQTVAQTPATGVQQAAQGYAQAANVPGFNGAVKPASTENTNVNFGNASFKTPTTPVGVNQKSASAPVAVAPQGAATASDKFALPPNFQLPQ
jgi:tetratricopeptide (TPR) repeat protein